MFGRDSTDRKEHLKDPYPGLFQNPPLLYPEFDVDKSLPLICYRILVDGECCFSICFSGFYQIIP